MAIFNLIKHLKTILERETMKTIFIIIFTFVLTSLAIGQSAKNTDIPPTLRVDFYHTGNALTEIFSLHQVVIEPLPWPGNPDRPIDNTNRGLYLFEVVKPVSNEVLHSRGFASIFGEWQFTGEAKRMHRTFHESVRFPRPDHPVKLRISKRDDANRFAAIWTIDIDPEDMLTIRKTAPAVNDVVTIINSGNPAKKVDLLIIGDGYTENEKGLFLKDAKKASKALFSVSPFKERTNDFNVRAINATALESGTNRPSNGTFRFSQTGTTYDAFRSERYVLAFDNESLRNIAQYAPYEFVLILANSSTYGGGGIFGLYSTAAAHSDWADYLVVHEFGHHFAALADEYYTSPNVYGTSEKRMEPWEPNVTAFHDPESLKWKHLVTKNTPIATPWPKKEFEAFQKENQARRMKLRQDNRPEEEMNQLFRDEQEFEENLFAESPYHESIGVFEGANYEATGFYRSEINCIMFTRYTKFCQVCRNGIGDIIDLYTK